MNLEKEPPISLLLTHPGGAHKDELLACSVLLALYPVAVHRREPTPADLEDPTICVVDVGHRHEPALRNFDHHQFGREHPPVCSLSLVLQFLGIYEDARQFCDWLEAAEWFDTRGPVSTAQWLEINPEVLPRLVSPIDIALLKRFSAASVLEPGTVVWEWLRLIGGDLLQYLRLMKERLAWIEASARVWSLEPPSGEGGSAKVLFLPRQDPLPEDPSLGVDRYLQGCALGEEVVGIVSPDRRGKGYGLSRFRDRPLLDFTRIGGCPDVHFAHARGFVAKTSAVEETRLRALLQMAAGWPLA